MTALPRVVLTGVTGLVGSALLQQLTARGYPVLALLRNPARLSISGVRTAEFHLDNITPQAAKEVVNFAPDIVIHAAWLGTENSDRDEPHYSVLNLQSSQRLLEIAVASGCRKWIGFGSQAEYSPGIETNIGEDTPVAPSSLYGVAKITVCKALQSACAAANIDFTWLRLFACYGKQHKPSYIIPYIIHCIRSGAFPTIRAPHAAWDYLYAEDMAEAVLALAKNTHAKGIYNLASGQGISVGEIALLLAELMNFSDIQGLRVHIAANTVPRTRRVANIAKLMRDSGWNPKTDMRLGLSQCL